jgi:acyl-CoA dehydrogenase
MKPIASILESFVLPQPAEVGDESLAELRREVRQFAATARQQGLFDPSCDAWYAGWDESFSRQLARRGWVGMTIPQCYGGAGRTAVERYVVIEELLAAGAPVAAHWAADRQMAPAILRFGTEEQRERFLPAIARGEYYFAIGMSEPDAGSDLASVRTRAQKLSYGWRLTGSKIWVTGAHRANAVMVFARTSPPDVSARHAGFSQFIVTTDSPGVGIRPIPSLAGDVHFNEVVFDEVFVPDEMLIGVAGNGWEQVTAELAFERSGPERFLSTFPLLEVLMAAAHSRGDRGALAVVGDLLARLSTLRHMALRVSSTLDRGGDADLPAALVKELGTRFEGEVVEVARQILAIEPDDSYPEPACRLLAQAIRSAPLFTIRGGTNEILRGVISRRLGLR